MAEWEADLSTHTGFRFHVRPVRAEDEAALQDFFGRVTQEDLRFRFLGTIKSVDHERLSAMIKVDHQRTESFIAYEHEGPPIIGAAMLASDDAMSTAEVAISIRPDFKGRGVSWELLRHLTRFAEAKGIRCLQSLEDRSNIAAISLEKEMGFVSRPYGEEPNVVLLEKTLSR
jgi:RimJ/RimL family protein N-acetyltransferase